jgi:hypothetical protein
VEEDVKNEIKAGSMLSSLSYWQSCPNISPHVDNYQSLSYIKIIFSQAAAIIGEIWQERDKAPSMRGFQ